MPHLLVHISGHGLGHLGQTAPVLAALRQRLPALRLTVRSLISRHLLAARIPGPFIHLREAVDVGFLQRDALTIDHEASRAAYQDFHAGYERRVAAEVELLAQLRPDLVLSNVAYLPLAGAAEAGVPAVAMSSLNWLDLVRHYYGGEAWAASALAEMAAAYDSADTFITLTPAMPMPDRPHRTPVGLVARVADAAARQALRCHYGLDDRALLVLFAAGGFDLAVSSDRWPDHLDGRPLHYLTPAAWDDGHARTHPYAIHDDFIGLLRAADAVVTKPGYGTFAEAAANGTPVLYLRREDWPEQDVLIPWLKTAGRCREISRDDLERGCWTDALTALLATPQQPLAAAEGADQVAAILEARLSISAA